MASSSSLLKDLSASQNCGTQNAIAGMASNVQQQQQMLANVRAFEDKTHMRTEQQPHQHQQHQQQHQQQHEMMMMMHQVQRNVEPAFSFGMGPQKFERPVPLGHMIHNSMPHQTNHQAAQFNASAMAEEFARMQVAMHSQQRQNMPSHADTMVAEFERAYAQPQWQAPSMHAGAWVSEFDSKRMENHAHAMHNMSQRIARGPMQWNAEFARVDHMIPMMPFASTYPQQMSLMPPTTVPQAGMYKHSLNETKTAHDKESEDLYGSSTTNILNTDDAYKDVQITDFVNEFNGMESGLNGGLDRGMLEKLMNSEDSKWKNSKFLKFINKINSGEIVFEGNQAIERSAQDAENGVNQYEKSTEQQKSWSEEFVSEEAERDWAEQFTDEMDEAAMEEWAKEYAKDQADHWRQMNMMNEFSAMAAEANKQAEHADPTYDFSSSNIFAEHPNPFAEGIRLLEAGHLKEAIQAFEAEVKRNPENADAWCYIGQAHAENESENNAIAALLQAVAIDPYNLKALMMLGVSYTNDLEEHRALNYMKTWLLNNPDYQVPQILAHKQSVQQYEQLYGGNEHDGQIVDITLHDEVTKMFLTALKLNPQDPDLHTVLGVLYHISGDFDNAIEAFNAATSLRPNDPQLWNKLGATQANSSRSQEAVHAYKKALELRPGYVRALANLAISSANQGMHEDAVRQFLQALSHNPNAEHIWSYLRISLSHLGKEDLVALSTQKNVELFRPYFTF